MSAGSTASSGLDMGEPGAGTGPSPMTDQERASLLSIETDLNLERSHI